MSEVIVHEPAPLGQQIEFAKALAPSGLLPREYQQNPANLLFALQYADALDVKPIHAITSIHVINGKPSASAELIASVVRRAGHKLRVTADDQEATAVLIRADDQGFEYTATWDLKRAQTAGLTSNPTWKKFPAAMLRSRAVTEVCRMGASDALYGVTHTPDELGGDFADAPEATAPAKPTGPTTRVSRKPKNPDPVPEVEQPPAVDAPSEQAFKRMFAILGENGLTGRDEALGYVSSIVGRDVATRSELNATEVAKVSDSFTPTPEENA